MNNLKVVPFPIKFKDCLIYCIPCHEHEFDKIIVKKQSVTKL